MEKKILKLFLYSDKLRFGEIVKGVGERSNLVSYHLGKLVKNGILNKESEEYSLSLESEGGIPYVSEKRALMVAVLVVIEKEGEVFLIRRKKRPFLGKLSLPGGRMVQGEDFGEAVARIMKKYCVKACFERVCSVTLEHVKREGESEKLHSFLLVLVKARSEDALALCGHDSGEPEYVDFRKKKSEVIGSDYKLLKRDLGKSIDIDTLETLG